MAEESPNGRGEGDKGRSFRSAEVAAFFERLNFFRKPMKVRNPYGEGWISRSWFAGDRIVQETLDGKKTIGLRASYTTTFMSFDIDAPGKPEEEAVWEAAEEPENGIEQTEGKVEVDEETRERWRREEEEIANWNGWKVLEDNGVNEELELALAQIEVPNVGSGMIGRRGIDLSPELKEAVEIVKGCCNVEPSLVVRSPHGAHVFWCLTEAKSWAKVKERAQRVKEEVEDRFVECRIEREIEVLPSLKRELRVPRKDRLLEPGTLEPMKRPVDGERFWRGLRTYRLEDIVKESVLERRRGEHGGKARHGPTRGKSREPKEKEGLPVGLVEEIGGGNENPIDCEPNEAGVGQRGQVGAKSESGNGERWRGRSKKPKSKEEAEATVLPFRNGETNDQLIAMVEAGKRSGMSVGEVEAWVWEWIERSRREGYTGDLGKNQKEVRDRVAALYARANVAAGRKKWLELWDEENGKYPRDEELAARMVKQLETVRPVGTRARKSLLRFMADLDVWVRIIDCEAGKEPLSLDRGTDENWRRGSYPMPHEVLKELHGTYGDYWGDVQKAGIVVKDANKGGQYVPSLGRSQSYLLPFRASERRG